MADNLRVSYSSVQDWRQCQQLYWYRYVLGLRPKVKAPALQLGTMFANYLEWYYGPLIKPKFRVTKSNLAKLHRNAVKKVARTYGDEIQAVAALADAADAAETAATLRQLPETVRVLAEAYHRVHGIDDLRQHKIIAVEQKFELPVADGIVLPGRIDMITKTSDGYWLWEHKTTKSVPEQGRRFRDLQTLIYRVAVEEIFHVELAGIIWNYVRTVRPTAPAVLKNGTLSVAKDQVTTYDLYVEEIMKQGLVTNDYEPYLRHIEERERMRMFPRHTLPLAQSEQILLRDYVATARDIQVARAQEDFVPVRNVAMHCDWCPFSKLCQIAIIGGDEDDVIRRHFDERDKEEEGDLDGKRVDEEVEELLSAID